MFALFAGDAAKEGELQQEPAARRRSGAWVAGLAAESQTLAPQPSVGQPRLQQQPRQRGFGAAQAQHTEAELRSLYQAAAVEGALSCDGLQQILEAQRIKDGQKERLPEAFVESLFQAWAGNGGISEQRFVYGYPSYFNSRLEWLRRWQETHKRAKAGNREVVERACFDLADGRGMVDEEGFWFLAERLAKSTGEALPPRAFVRELWLAFTAAARKTIGFLHALEAEESGGSLLRAAVSKGSLSPSSQNRSQQIEESYLKSEGRRLYYEEAAMLPPMGQGAEGSAGPASMSMLPFESFLECAQVYDANWQKWLHNWLESKMLGDQAIQNAVHALELDPNLVAKPSAGVNKAGCDDAIASSKLISTLEEVLAGGSCSKLFEELDSKGRGTWSEEDVHRFCYVLWCRDGLECPPVAFAPVALRLIRWHAQEAAKEIGGTAMDLPTRATGSLREQEVEAGLMRFVARHQEYLSQWASLRAQQLFACPRCKGHFRTRLENGCEIAIVGEARPPVQWAAGHETASSLLPADDAASKIRGIAQKAVLHGEQLLWTPPGIGRPALTGALMLEATHRNPQLSCLGLLSSEQELMATSVWLAAAAPQAAWRRLGLKPAAADLSSNGRIEDEQMPLFLGTCEQFQDLFVRGRLDLKAFDCIVVNCYAGQVPPIAELSAGQQPLSIGSEDPRVIALLDAADSQQQVFFDQIKTSLSAVKHLQRASEGVDRISGLLLQDLPAGEAKQLKEVLQTGVEALSSTAGTASSRRMEPFASGATSWSFRAKQREQSVAADAKQAQQLGRPPTSVALQATPAPQAAVGKQASFFDWPTGEAPQAMQRENTASEVSFKSAREGLPAELPKPPRSRGSFLG